MVVLCMLENLKLTRSICEVPRCPSPGHKNKRKNQLYKGVHGQQARNSHAMTPCCQFSVYVMMHIQAVRELIPDFLEMGQN